ncbi:hypothetical protein D3C75_1196980 [compost metagenome]
MKIGKIIYYLLGMIIGVGCFIAFLIVIFYGGEGFFKNSNHPLAITAVVTAVVVVIAYFIIGYKIDKDMAAFGLMLVLLFATLSASFLFSSLG